MTVSLLRPLGLFALALVVALTMLVTTAAPIATHHAGEVVVVSHQDEASNLITEAAHHNPADHTHDLPMFAGILAVAVIPPVSAMMVHRSGSPVLARGLRVERPPRRIDA